MIGQTVSHYEITEIIGEGWVEEVYEIQDTNLSRKVNHRFLIEYLRLDIPAQETFFKEIRSAAAINHSLIRSSSSREVYKKMAESASSRALQIDKNIAESVICYEDQSNLLTRRE